ncbi:hypothetical protein VCHA50P417_20476 [Vibrio chagasii]|nr:hypothetical protein VCHA50P417_20476 [Vibrio chagasii]
MEVVLAAVIGGALLIGGFSFFGEGRSDSAKVAFEHYPECEVSYPANKGKFIKSAKIITMSQEDYGSCAIVAEHIPKAQHGSEEYNLALEQCPSSKKFLPYRQWTPRTNEGNLFLAKGLNWSEAACINAEQEKWQSDAAEKQREPVVKAIDAAKARRKAREDARDKKMADEVKAWKASPDGIRAKSLCVNTGKQIARGYGGKFVELRSFAQFTGSLVYCSIYHEQKVLMGSRPRYTTFLINEDTLRFEIRH